MDLSIILNQKILWMNKKYMMNGKFIIQSTKKDFIYPPTLKSSRMSLYKLGIFDIYTSIIFSIKLLEFKIFNLNNTCQEMKQFENYFVFIKLMAVVLAIQFYSWYEQIPGTIGHDGIAPVDVTIKDIKNIQYFPILENAKTIQVVLNWFLIRFVSYFVPNFSIHETVITVMCLLGLIISIAIIIDRSFNDRFYNVAFLLLFVFHVHLVAVMGPFLQQQDLLLNEVMLFIPFLLLSHGKKQKKDKTRRLAIYESPINSAFQNGLKALIFRYLFVNGVKILIKEYSTSYKWSTGRYFQTYPFFIATPNLIGTYLLQVLSPIVVNVFAMVYIVASVFGMIMFVVPQKNIRFVVATVNIIVQLILGVIMNNGFEHLLIAVLLTLFIDEEFYRTIPNIFRIFLGLPTRSRLYFLTNFKSHLQWFIISIVIAFVGFSLFVNISIIGSQSQDRIWTFDKKSQELFNGYVLDGVFLVLLVTSMIGIFNTITVLKKRRFVGLVVNKQSIQAFLAAVIGVYLIYDQYVLIKKELKDEKSRRKDNRIVAFKHSMLDNIKFYKDMYRLQSNYENFQILNSSTQRTQNNFYFTNSNKENFEEVKFKYLPRKDLNYMPPFAYFMPIRMETFLYSTKSLKDNKYLSHFLFKLSSKSKRTALLMDVSLPKIPFEYITVQSYSCYLNQREKYVRKVDLTKPMWIAGSTEDNGQFGVKQLEDNYKKSDFPVDYKVRLAKDTHPLQSLPKQSISLVILSAYLLVGIISFKNTFTR